MIAHPKDPPPEETPTDAPKEHAPNGDEYEHNPAPLRPKIIRRLVQSDVAWGPSVRWSALWLFALLAMPAHALQLCNGVSVTSPSQVHPLCSATWIMRASCS